MSNKIYLVYFEDSPTDSFVKGVFQDEAVADSFVELMGIGYYVAEWELDTVLYTKRGGLYMFYKDYLEAIEKSDV